MFNPRVGAFQISLNGDTVRCAPREEVTWRWQRYLLGRVLPFVATIRGLEPWHASAVAVHGGAVAMMAESAAGKTTVAAELMLLGAELLADDVIAVQVSDQGIVVHPSPPLMSVRTRPHQAFTDADLERLGTLVGRQDGALRLAVPRATRPLRLRALYLLSPGTAEGTLEPLAAADSLLGGTFVFAIRSSDRLRRQLDAASGIARQAAPARIGAPPGADLRAVARAIYRDSLARLEGGQ